ncbi:trace amine-associated receptor 13c-like [Girardinichthys multiradiatus]|uniref:trace amine-associated receptor 13c-like n=1 Tax=Girardinichthys multiradiatus TaxID=208333 RepID=UPI001FAD12D8|nr:trace amine-associated receptor 13c-like [Girardinichthys multiradiatus]
MKTFENTELCFPQLLNSSCRKIMGRSSVSLLIYFTLSFISLLTVTLNLMVIISISHFKNLHSPTNILLLSLAVSDCMVGFLISFQIVLIDGCWYLGDIICTLYVVLDYVITSASIGTMVLISVDRYVAICYPLYYPSKVTAERTKMCVSLCWMFAFLCHSLLLKDSLQKPGRYNSCFGECVVVLDYIGGITDLLLSFIGPVTAILVLYVRVFVVVVSQVQAIQSHVSAASLQGSVRVSAKKSEMKAAVILGIVVVVFLICTCPYFCVILMAEGAEVSASSVTFLLFYFNSTLNPLIYALFYPWFRKSVKLILTLQILKSDSSDTIVM